MCEIWVLCAHYAHELWPLENVLQMEFAILAILGCFWSFITRKLFITTYNNFLLFLSARTRSTHVRNLSSVRALRTWDMVPQKCPPDGIRFFGTLGYFWSFLTRNLFIPTYNNFLLFLNCRVRSTHVRNLSSVRLLRTWDMVPQKCPPEGIRFWPF